MDHGACTRVGIISLAIITLLIRRARRPLPQHVFFSDAIMVWAGVCTRHHHWRGHKFYLNIFLSSMISDTFICQFGASEHSTRVPFSWSGTHQNTQVHTVEDFTS